MSWQGQATTIIRHLLSDLDTSSQDYTDHRLEQAFLVNGILEQITTDFINDYTINVETCYLSPDPTDTDTKDTPFVALICLRAACMIVGSEIRKESGNAISIKDGPSAINLQGVTTTLTTLWKDLCEQYEQTLMEYRAGNSVAGAAILTPYSPGSDNFSNRGDHRSGSNLY